MADPGFRRVQGKTVLLGKIFAKNCMKMKEMGQKGGARCYRSLNLDPPMEYEKGADSIFYFAYNLAQKIFSSRPGDIKDGKVVTYCVQKLQRYSNI